MTMADWSFLLTGDGKATESGVIPLWRLIVGMFIFCCGHCWVEGLLPSIYSKLKTDERHQAETMGYLMAAAQVACIVGPVAGSSIFDAEGRVVFLYCSVCMALAASLLYVLDVGRS
eukprot:GFYU01003196.1.p1 GENE.GFYU01003196.1~~GFYU01003196.1.p1  ORF type:complete len:116 (-),score=27.65 GFYU01003196.1:175-522(-)